MVRCVRGQLTFEIEVAPRFDYGRREHTLQLTAAGAVFTAGDAGLTLHAVRAPDDDQLAEVRPSGEDLLRAAAAVGRPDPRGRPGVGGRPAAGDPAGGDRARARGHRPVLAGLAGPVDVPGPVAGDGAALGDHAEADDLRPDRRAGRGPDRGPAGAGRRRAELGLPLHLDPGRVVLGARAARARLRRRGGRVRAVAAGPGGGPGRAQGRAPAGHHVPGGRLVRPGGGVPRPLVRLPRVAPGPDRQRRGRAAPARHLRRGVRQPLRRRPGRHPDRAPRVDGAVRGARLARGQLGPARGGHLGDPRRAEGLHLRAGDELGRVRPGDPAGRRARPAGPAGAVDPGQGRDLRPDHGEGLERRPRRLRAALRESGAGLVAAADVPASA